MKLHKHIILVIAILQLIIQLPANANEDIKLVTDRDVYVSGEFLLAKIFVETEDPTQVVYLDLVNSGGNHINGAKFLLENGAANGFLSIPDSLSTGTYFLKVFTNQRQEQFFFLKELLVINRFERFLNELVIDKSNLENESIKELSVQLNNLKPAYSKRENAMLTLGFPLAMDDLLKGEVVVSVSEEVAGFNSGSSLVEKEFFDSTYLNEEKGIILKGKVLEKSTGDPVWGALVYLSIPDSIPFFDYYKTGDDGSFYFLLKDFFGVKPLVVQASKNGEHENLYIQLDEKFKSIPLDFSSQKEQLEGELLDYVTQSVQLVTFKKIFDSEEYILHEKKSEPIYSYPFYGEPVYRVDPDLFFDFKDFKELSKEILPSVKYRERKDGNTLQLIDQQVEDYFQTTPFMLLDGVPIDEISMISSMGTREIDWVDIIPRERYYGDLKFNGVLAIYTKDADASRITAADHLLKLNYEGLQNRIALTDSIPDENNTPDFRQLLYWNPKINPAGETTIKFRCPDVRGAYCVTVSGVDKSGELLRSVYKFKVE